MEKEYTYSAFISYSHEDEKIAKSLWKKLERYRLPAVLQKQYEGVPEKIHVFLDQGDIVPGDTVENALSRELADSKKLIVICSPNSAKSPYVELEVKNFLLLGHSFNDIIPYIIEGEIERESLNNCYVPSLFGDSGKDTINGVSVLRDGKWKAFVGVLANLLDVKFDEIYKREKVRKNRIAAVWSVIGTLTACFISLVIWYITPHTRYYADYISRWGIPEGIYPLRRNQISSIPFHYEITTRYLRPIKLVYANPSGIPSPYAFWTEKHNFPSIAFYSYKNAFFPTVHKEKWVLNEASCIFLDNDFESDIKKSCIVKLKYVWEKNNHNSRIEFYYNSDDEIEKSLSNNILSDACLFFSDIVESDNAERADFKTPEEKIFNESGAIFRCTAFYDENGFEKKVFFNNKNNQAVSDRNGIKGVINEYDDMGRIASQTYLYSYIPSLSDIYKKQYFYNSHNLAGICFVDKTNCPSLNPVRNYSASKILWDDNNGEIICSISFFDADNKPLNALSCSAYSVQNKYDEKKYLTEQLFRKKNDNPFINQSEIVKKYFFENTEKGVPKTIIEYENDLLIQKITSVHEEMTHLSNYQSPIKKIYFSQLGEKLYSVNYEYQDEESFYCKMIERISDYPAQEKIKNEYDLYGRLSAEIHENANGETLTTQIKYSGSNKIISHYKDGKYSDKDGFSTACFSYTNDGMLYFAQFFSEQGNLSDSVNLGFSEYVSLFSPSSLRLYESFKDKNGEFTAPNDNYAYYVGCQNLDDTYLTEGAYYSKDGNYAFNKQIVRFYSKENEKGKFDIFYLDKYDNIILTLPLDND